MTAKVNGLAPVPPDGTDPARGRLRVVFLMRVEPDAQARFLEAYQRIRQQVASTPGHLVDQLCQSTADSAEWMIVSEWQSPDHFHAWEQTAGHRELAGPLVACTTRRQSLRFVVHHQTVGTSDPAPVPKPDLDHPAPAPAPADPGPPAPDRKRGPRGITTVSVDIGGPR